MSESMAWGDCDQRSDQGWARVVGLGTWTVSWSGTHNTHERDGKVTYRDHAWRSENDINVGYPFAITNDFGELVPVPCPRHVFNLERVYE